MPNKKNAIQRVLPLSQNYVLLDQLLFQLITIPDKEKALLAIPESCTDKIISLYHSSLFTGHQGVIKTYLAMTSKFFIPNLMHYLRAFLKACHICQLNRNDKPHSRQLETRINLNYRPMSRLSITKNALSRKLLGAWIDKNLNMKQHKPVKCKIAMWNVQKIKHIRKYLTQEAAQLLTSSIVMSHLDYANSLLYGLPKCDLDRMQQVQNIVGKIVINESKYSSSTEMLKTLHWLPINCRIEYKLLTLVHNCLDKSAPSYLIDLLRRKAPN